MSNKPVFVVDLDNTLWPFEKPLRAHLHRYFDMPIDVKWDKWEFYKDYAISDSDFYEAVSKIHRMAGIFPQEHRPYSGAAELLDYLGHLGTVMIASHREPSLFHMTANYLNSWGLKAPGLYVGWDKSFLYTDNAVVIDDSPKNIQIAIGRGIPVLSLRQDWNKDMELPLFDNLNQMYEYISRSKYGATNGRRRQPGRI